MPSIDDCAEELLRLYSSSRINRVSVELARMPSEFTGSPRGLSLIVKSVHEPSIDEVPLLDAIMGSLEFSEVYEYERVAEVPEGTRAEHLATFLSEALANGRGAVVVMPSLMTVSLTSRLSDELLEALDEGALATVSLSADNVLYLPLREALGDSAIEIVAKSNSRSSYERVRWLRGEAERRGIRVKGEVYLDDNRMIAEYVTSIGERGYLYRVPVTKLAMIVAAIDRCTEGNSVEVIRRSEESEHTVYAVNVGETEAKRLTSSLTSIRAAGAPLISISERLRPFMERGSREVIAEVSRRLGLI